MVGSYPEMTKLKWLTHQYKASFLVQPSQQVSSASMLLGMGNRWLTTFPDWGDTINVTIVNNMSSNG